MNKKKTYLTLLFTLFFIVFAFSNQTNVGSDTFAIHTLGHGTLMIETVELVIHIDPCSSQADYTQLPKADIIFVTHGHGDHYDLSTLNEIIQTSTVKDHIYCMCKGYSYHNLVWK